MIITSPIQAAEFAGQIVFINYEKHPFCSHFYRLQNKTSNFSDGSFGYGAACEVRADGVHGMYGLTDYNIEKFGPVDIRLATPEEVARVKISYESYEGNGQ